MTGSVALDVTIGLVFIYLLYSLYATILMEIISSSFGLRARNLRYAIARMLMDEKHYRHSFFIGLWRVFASFTQVAGKTPNLTYSTLFNKFFKQPAIKYLSSGGINNMPSYISAESFSKGLIDAIRINDPEISMLASIEEGMLRFQLTPELKTLIERQYVTVEGDKEKFKIAMEQWSTDTSGRVMSRENMRKLLVLASESKNSQTKFKESLDAWFNETEQFALGPETKKQLQSLLDEANNDIVKFRLLIEQWYNDTMERSIGWFKRSTQIILLIIGLVLAIVFNVDTFAVIKKLSVDKDAREQLVKMAVDFTEKNKDLIESINKERDSVARSTTELKARLDSLYSIRNTLKEDIVNSQALLSSDWDLPAGEDTFLDKLHYACCGGRIWGYLLTALAISLGAPFWFDLLNKLVKLRSSKAIPTLTDSNTTTNSAIDTNRTILNRAG